MKQLTDADFDSATSKGVVLVDFWATWCSACKALTPTIEKLAEDYQGKVEFYKIDCDDNQEQAAKLGIRGLPTVILFKDGKQVALIVGKQDRSVFEKAIQGAL